MCGVTADLMVVKKERDDLATENKVGNMCILCGDRCHAKSGIKPMGSSRGFDRRCCFVSMQALQ